MDLSYLAYKSYFEEFWEVYPRREGKERSYLEYCKAIDSREVTQDHLIEQAKKYAHKVKGSDYILMPERWLRDKRWQDDLPDIPKLLPAQGLISKIEWVLKKTPTFPELRQINALLKNDDGAAETHFAGKSHNGILVMDYIRNEINKMIEISKEYK